MIRSMTPSVNLRIEGMTCGGCVSRVEKALSSVPGVDFARVNLATETASVSFRGPVVAPADLLSAVRGAGYDAELLRRATPTPHATEAMHQTRLRERKQAMIWAAGLAVPILGVHAFAPVLSSPERGGHVWPGAIQAILALCLLLSLGGAPILAGGLRALAFRLPNMDLLVSLGVTVAFLAGGVGLFTGSPHQDHFHAVATILGFINVGRFLEAWSKWKAVSSVAGLAAQTPTTARRLTEHGSEVVPVELILPGDRIGLAQDMTIPLDGIVVEGEAAVDESAITGEPLPRRRTAPDEVPGGGIVREGSLVIQVMRVGREATLGRIARAVEEAQSGTTRMQRIADRVAGAFVPFVIALAALTLFATVTLFEQTWSVAVQRAVAVIVIACPCAMGLATPMAVLVATGTAARMGILIRDAAAIEAAAAITHVVLDKTGTLTSAHPTVSEFMTVATPPSATDKTEWFRLAASAEQLSQHPLARAIVDEARKRNLLLMGPDHFVSKPGAGVYAVVDGHDILVGGEAFLRQEGIETLEQVQSEAGEGDVRSTAMVAVDGLLCGVIRVEDSLRPGAKEAVARLQSLGRSVAMLTGDRQDSALSIAARVGISDVAADASPDDKLAELRRRQQRGQRVAFVGDGINDAPALAAADVGITFATAADLARSAAPVSIVHTDLLRVPALIVLAEKSLRVIRQNLFWAFFYNVAAIALAASGRIPPGLAAAAMMTSSICVVVNSLRLRASGHS